MPANAKAVSPSKVGDLGKTASKQQAHNSHFARKYKEIDWFFLVILTTMSCLNFMAGLALVFGGRAGL